MAARFWVAGSGTASDIAHWSAASGVAGGAAIPTANDDVTFDAASNGVSYTVTIDNAFVSKTTTVGNPATGTVSFVNDASPVRSWSLAGNMSVAATLAIASNSAINRLVIQSTVPGTLRTIAAAGVSFTDVGLTDVVIGGAAVQSSSCLLALRNQFRVDIADKTTPQPLWADAEVDRLINLAYFEAVDRGLLIFDRTSFTVVTAATVREYALDPSIIRIKWAWLVGLTVDGVTDPDVPIYSMTSDEVVDWTRWSRFRSDIMYQTVSFGAMRYGVTEDRAFILVPTPTEARTIRLEVWRYPKVKLVYDADVPEIPELYHSKMLAWALHLAYDQQDTDTKDAAKAKKFADDFERDFGPPKNAQQRRAQLENRTLRTRPSPF